MPVELTDAGSAYATICHMGKTLTRTISASLALAALTDACDAVRASEQETIRLRAERDELIRDARAASIPYTTIMRKTGLSRDRLIKIAFMPDSRDGDDD